MIQRIQSVFLLISIGLCALLFFLPMGYVEPEGQTEKLTFMITGFANEMDGFGLEYIISLPIILGLTMLLQLVSIFLYKNLSRQAKMVQVTLILLLVFAFLTLLYQDIFGTSIGCFPMTDKIQYTWNILLLAIPWILTFMALRRIKKDEALIRSADRMR